MWWGLGGLREDWVDVLVVGDVDVGRWPSWWSPGIGMCLMLRE